MTPPLALDQNRTCSLCTITVYQKEEYFCRLANCNHVFHFQCLRSTVKTVKRPKMDDFIISCPTCKTLASPESVRPLSDPITSSNTIRKKIPEKVEEEDEEKSILLQENSQLKKKLSRIEEELKQEIERRKSLKKKLQKLQEDFKKLKNEKDKIEVELRTAENMKKAQDKFNCLCDRLHPHFFAHPFPFPFYHDACHMAAAMPESNIPRSNPTKPSKTRAKVIVPPPFRNPRRNVVYYEVDEKHCEISPD